MTFTNILHLNIISNILNKDQINQFSYPNFWTFFKHSLILNTTINLNVSWEQLLPAIFNLNLYNILYSRSTVKFSKLWVGVKMEHSLLTKLWEEMPNSRWTSYLQTELKKLFSNSPTKLCLSLVLLQNPPLSRNLISLM